jgi:hypothetical protein
VKNESIYSLLPLDTSGRRARKGFEYQDHVGAFLLLLMLLDETLKEVWFETEDDLTLIWNNKGIDTVEFIQVKHENLPSRYSVSTICSKNGSKESLLEKSLKQDRCREKTKFRFITSYDVDRELSVLKLPLNEKFRTAVEETKKEQLLISAIEEHLPDFKSPNGNGIDYWVKNCFWDKFPDSIASLEAKNKICFEEILNGRPFGCYPDQRNELYQQILARVKKASTEDIVITNDASRITRQDLLTWFDLQLSELRAPKGATVRLKEKLVEAGIDSVLINRAEELKWEYMSAKLDSDFVKGSQFSVLEKSIANLLFDLKLKLDAGQLELDGPNFLLRCKQEVEALAEAYPNLLKEHAVAFMFDYTNRCLHRYIKPNK